MTFQQSQQEKVGGKKVNGHPPPSPPETIYGETTSPAPVEFPLPPPSETPTQVLDVDKKTPDAHVPRDPRLIRLTGVHPFNVEAPLSDLYNEGFLTSPELFYVRNHGAVPEVLDEEIPDWEFTVEGLVENPLKISLKELLSEYDNVTYPITLVCAGNRRKEQNVVRKTKGFSWGAAGVSTALWTGVVMGDVLRRARPMRKARYVCMEGADKLPNGYYGTSVKLNWAMDPNRGMMIAHKMNGETLTPDHGKPLRCVIPGQIGGRSVKWLKKLIVTAEPSDNWYHINDNRVLPTMVSPDDAANDPNWWKDERYAIYDLSTNSAIAYPAHDEQLSLVGGPEKYRVKGYAYGGGGRRITRAEVSIDKGKTWRLANIDYGEDRYRDAAPQDLYGGRLDVDWRESCFCWCFWDIEVPVSELKDASDVIVRAMDESMNLQPRDMYWSVLGMMNNPWYRIAISCEDDHLRFEHPTQPALMPGGWMERVKKAGGNLSNGYWGEKFGGEETEVPVVEQAGEIKMTNDKVKREITIGELRKHDTEKEPWFVVNGEVYDGTAFLQGHPGGAQSIISAAGLDATDEFMAIRKSSHSIRCRQSLTRKNRQRDRKDHDARLPHRHPRRRLQARSQRARVPTRTHRAPRSLPQLTRLDPSLPPRQETHLLGHAYLHLPPRARNPSPRPAHGAAPADAPARPGHARRHHPPLHAAVGADAARLRGHISKSLLCLGGAGRGRQDDQSPGLAAARPRRRPQGPGRQVRVPGRRALRYQRRAAALGQALRHGLRRQRHHANLSGAARGDARRPRGRAGVHGAGWESAGGGYFV